MASEATSPTDDKRLSLPGGGSAMRCHHCQATNLADRRFCASCGQPLWEACVECCALCVVGEAFCGGCGVNLAKALAQVRQRYECALNEAQRLADIQHFDEAAKLIASLPEITDERLREYAERVGGLRAELSERSAAAKTFAQQIVQAAELCVVTRDYAGALESLERIPPPLRDEEMQTLIKELQGYVQEVETLQRELEAAVPRAQPQDASLLSGKVERLLDLRPEDARTRRWLAGLEELQQRHQVSERERLMRAAKEHVERFEYEPALECLRQIAPVVRTPELEKQIDLLAELAWLKWDLCHAPVIDATLIGVGQRLLKLKPDDRDAAAHLGTMQIKLQAPPPGVRLAAPRWIKAPDTTPIGHPIDWVGGFRRIGGELLQAEGMRAHPGCFCVAAGLALQGLELAPIRLNLMPSREGLLGRMTAALRKSASDSAWGLDLSSWGLKAMRLSAKTGHVVCEDFEVIEHEVDLGRPEAETEWRPIVRKTLETFLSRHDTKGTRVCLAVSRPRVLGRFFDLPPMESKKKLTALVEYEAAQQVPYPLDQLSWDYQVLEEPAQEDAIHSRQQAVLVGARRYQLDERLEICQELGLRVDIVQADCVAVHNFFVYDHFGEAATPEPDGQSLAILDVGSDTTHLVVSQPYSLWFRTLNFGANEFNGALTRAFQMTFEQAEHAKRNPLSCRRLYQWDEALRATREEFVQEIHRSLAAHSNLAKNRRISRVFAIGGGFQLHGLLRHFRVGA
jgi:type IV pilus assembly protein PilM